MHVRRENWRAPVLCSINRPTGPHFPLAAFQPIVFSESTQPLCPYQHRGQSRSKVVGVLPAGVVRVIFLPASGIGTLYSDASGAYGCGVVVDAESWFQVSWQEEWETVDISVKEFLPVVVAAALWGNTWQGKHIHFHSDNMAVVVILGPRLPN